jgi:rubrerythrin
MANQTKSVTIENLEAAFAGESMAHIKYRYFAKLARAAGAIEVAEAFEATADQEVAHAFGHLDLLYPKDKMTPARALKSRSKARPTNTPRCTPNSATWRSRKATCAAVAEYDEQIEESKVHAAQFKRTLEIAAKRFAALANVETPRQPLQGRAGKTHRPPRKAAPPASTNNNDFKKGPP